MFWKPAGSGGIRRGGPGLRSKRGQRRRDLQPHGHDDVTIALVAFGSEHTGTHVVRGHELDFFPVAHGHQGFDQIAAVEADRQLFTAVRYLDLIGTVTGVRVAGLDFESARPERNAYTLGALGR